MGNSSDTKMSADISDEMRPTVFQLSEAGKQGDGVVALVPHKDAYLLGFTASATWVLQGDPVKGSLRRVSDRVGIIGADAWCVNHDTVYFLSSSGLYSVGADGSGLTPISEDRIPEDLTGVSDADCTLTYQHSDRGVYIHLTEDPDWFYDTAREGFWPFDTDTTDSHVLLGPLKLGALDRAGVIKAIHGMIASGSADVDWHLVVGETAEESAANGKAAITASLAGSSYDSYVQYSGTWSAGRSTTTRPRVRGLWCCLWLKSEGTWAFERSTIQIGTAGLWR
jgi:hypothetical protein